MGGRVLEDESDGMDEDEEEVALILSSLASFEVEEIERKVLCIENIPLGWWRNKNKSEISEWFRVAFGGEIVRIEEIESRYGKAMDVDEESDEEIDALGLLDGIRSKNASSRTLSHQRCTSRRLQRRLPLAQLKLRYREVSTLHSAYSKSSSAKLRLKATGDIIELQCSLCHPEKVSQQKSLQAKTKHQKDKSRSLVSTQGQNRVSAPRKKTVSMDSRQHKKSKQNFSLAQARDRIEMARLALSQDLTDGDFEGRTALVESAEYVLDLASKAKKLSTLQAVVVRLENAIAKLERGRISAARNAERLRLEKLFLRPPLEILRRLDCTYFLESVAQKFCDKFHAEPFAFRAATILVPHNSAYDPCNPDHDFEDDCWLLHLIDAPYTLSDLMQRNKQNPLLPRLNSPLHHALLFGKDMRGNCLVSLASDKPSPRWAKILQSDFYCDSGTILHIVDRILFPSLLLHS